MCTQYGQYYTTFIAPHKGLEIKIQIITKCIVGRWKKNYLPELKLYALNGYFIRNDINGGNKIIILK